MAILFGLNVGHYTLNFTEFMTNSFTKNPDFAGSLKIEV